MRLAIMAVCVAAAFAISACGNDDSNKSSSAGATSSTAATSSTPAAPAGEQELKLSDFRFDPKTVKGQPGQKVTLELRNEGKTEHNFSVDSQKIDKDVEAGEDGKVTVTLPKSGTLQFYCSYHKSQGMTGTIAAGGASAPAPSTTDTDKSGSDDSGY